MIILSIDPGFERLGIAVIQKEKNQKEELLYSECFKTSAKIEHHKRLAMVQNKINEIISKFNPEVLATETLLFSVNAKTAMAVAEVRGVILANASINNLEVFEYNPNTIKLAITGYGASDKSAVAKMVPKLIDTKDKEMIDDEIDAIAVGLTYLAMRKTEYRI